MLLKVIIKFTFCIVDRSVVLPTFEQIKKNCLQYAASSALHHFSLRIAPRHRQHEADYHLR